VNNGSSRSIFHLRHQPSPAAISWASRSLPPEWSARGIRLHAWAALAIPALAALPLFLPWAAYIMAPLFILAAALRTAALLHLAMPPVPEAAPLADSELPTLTVLLPLFRERAVLPDLVAAMERIDYPRHLVEFTVLLEECDRDTRAAAHWAVPRFSNWNIVVVPAGDGPRTKPRAVNVGAALAQGEVITIYDGEDRPEVSQARRAVAALLADPSRAVVQCALAADHGGPWFTRCWTAEYRVLFGAILPALSRARLPFLLGGTSQFIRREALMSAGAYDAWNVTEDADLGVRLARLGWTSAAISATTHEEAPVTLRAFLNQRRRWIAGHIKTAVVHLRDPLRTWRELGPVASLALLAQLPAAALSTAAHPLGLAFLLGGGMDGLLGWLLALGYLAALALYAASTRSLRTLFMLPTFWLLQTIALGLALTDLVRRPHHWHKTTHGVAARPAQTMEAQRLRAS
jgi:glycosyltransferase XagB